MPAMATPPISVPPVLPAELLPLDGTDWNRVVPVRGVDGDTVRLRRQQLSWTLFEECEIGDGTLLQEWKLRVIADDPEELPDGIAVRLVNLDTPERGEPGYREASDEVWAWIMGRRDRLRCITYDAGGGFDRLLVDLYVLCPDGRTVEETASQWMLKRGWLPYVGRA